MRYLVAAFAILMLKFAISASLEKTTIQNGVDQSVFRQKKRSTEHVNKQPKCSFKALQYLGIQKFSMCYLQMLEYFLKLIPCYQRP